MFLQHFLMLSLMQTVVTLPEVIHLGGVFDEGDDIQIAAFSNAIERINRNQAPSNLRALVTTFKKDDSIDASMKVCDLLSKGVAAVFGPSSLDASAHIQSICDALGVPYIQTRLDARDEFNTHVINLYPHWSILGRAYADLINQWGWKSFTILYEDNAALVKLRDLFKTPSKSSVKITSLQLPAGNNYRDLLRSVKDRNEKKIVVDCSVEILYHVLKQAQQVGMMTELYHYVVTSLDVETINLEDFRYGGTNITAFRLISPLHKEVIAATRSLNMTEIGDRNGSHNPNGFFLKTETALLFDAVQMFATAAFNFDGGNNRIDIKKLSCEMKNGWDSGPSLFNYMKMVQLQGLSGIVGFGGNGFRSVFSLDIMELHETGLEKVGSWGSGYKDQTWNNGLHITRVITKNTSKWIAPGQKLIVTTLLSKPYVMERTSIEPLHDNNRYEGFCVDLLEKVANIVGFNYTIQLVHDRAHGIQDNVTQKWNGMVGEIVEKRADLAIGDLSISVEREQVVEFSTPFMDLGIAILFRKAQPAPPSLLSFLSPFSKDVWFYMAITYVGVSIILFILARLSPYEWDNPHPCIQEPEVLQNDFNFLNSMWFTIGSLMQQGSDIAPKAASTRLVAGIWWFYTLIMISSYTANLTAFLTVENLASPINDVKDLAKQTKIKYGSLPSGSTFSFFRHSNVEHLKKIYDVMTTCDPSCLVATSGEGIARVLKGDYAFFMESISIQYYVEGNCNLTQIGGPLDTKFFGIAFPKNSPLISRVSEAILQLQRDGVLPELKTKWWKQKNTKATCKDDKASSTTPLTLGHVGGIFVVLIAGMILATIVAIMEFIWKTRKEPNYERGSVCHEMVKELAFAVKCRETKKVTKKLPTEPENGMALPLSKFSLTDRDMYA